MDKYLKQQDINGLLQTFINFSSVEKRPESLTSLLCIHIPKLATSFSLEHSKSFYVLHLENNDYKKKNGNALFSIYFDFPFYFTLHSPKYSGYYMNIP